MIWGKEDITDFIATVAPPGEQHKRYDDRILYDDAVEFACAQGDDGKPLLDALQKMLKQAPSIAAKAEAV
jgi:hypothetical protein